MPVYRCFVDLLYCHESILWPSVRAVGDAFICHLNIDSSIEAQKETKKKEQAFTYVHFILKGKKKVETFIQCRVP
jgi:hypothetical protein